MGEDLIEVGAAIPHVADGLSVGASVDHDNRRVLLRWIEAFGLDETGVEGSSVFDFEAGEFGGEDVVLIEGAAVCGFELLELLAIGVVEGLAGGAVNGRVVVGIELGSGAHRDGVSARFGGELALVFAVEADDVEVALEGANFGRGVVDKLLVEVDSGNIVYFPIAFGNLAKVFAVEAEKVEVAGAGALAGPDNLLAGAIDFG